MLKFDIITIFPHIFDSFLKESLIKQAQKKGFIKVNIHDLRQYSKDKHKTVDDKAFGGGRGMVMKIEPIYKALKALKKKGSHVILFSPRGKRFDQKTAYRLSRAKNLVFICGRYEGVDERVAKHLVDEIISIGEFVMMGGELPAMVALETIARLVPKVVGKSDLLIKERVTEEKGFLEYPQYTRPEVFSPKPKTKWKVPKVLLSGNHKEIEKWRVKHQKVIER